jgi:hypothetical protein
MPILNASKNGRVVLCLAVTYNKCPPPPGVPVKGYWLRHQRMRVAFTTQVKFSWRRWKPNRLLKTANCGKMMGKNATRQQIRERVVHVNEPEVDADANIRPVLLPLVRDWLTEVQLNYRTLANTVPPTHLVRLRDP